MVSRRYCLGTTPYQLEHQASPSSSFHHSPCSGTTNRMKSEVTRQYRALARDSRPRPFNPRPPSISFEALSGQYENPGYGTVDFCFIFKNKSASDVPSPCDDSWTTLPSAIDTSVPTLLAKWDKAWSTHIMLTHFDGNLFNVSTLESRVRIYQMLPCV